jgi:Protein of unknown function (DUF3800)
MPGAVSQRPPSLSRGVFSPGGSVRMFVAYVDDSGDSKSFVLGAVLVDAERWLAALDQLIAFRAGLSQTVGFRMRYELKATRFVSNGGAWRRLNVPMRKRFGIYKLALAELASLAPAVRTVAVVIPDRTDARLVGSPREVAWDVLMERLERFGTVGKGGECLIIADEGSPAKLKTMARRKRRFGYAPAAFGGPARKVPFRVLLDDPVNRDSSDNYFVQWADLVAYAAFRQIVSFPIVPPNLWDDLGDARLAEANRIERQKGSKEPPGLIVWPSRLR